MSKIALTPNANGSGVFTLASPNSNTNRTITLPDESVTLGAGTPSIDDNGNATAITIDSSENVMLGTTTATLYNATSGTGFSYRNGVALDIARQNTSSAEPLLNLNLTGVDGSHILLYKDGTTVGSIGVNSGDNLYLAGGTGSTKGIYFNDHGMVPADTGGSPLDNGADLGVSNNRWKDLYLSGGVYLGGTGSANKLEDYETGTWTPAFVSGTFSYGIRTGWYTKVGDLVTCGFLIIWSSKSGSGTINITLPFTTSSGAHYRYAGSTGYMSGVDIGSSYKDFTFTTTPSTANVALVLNGDNIAGAGAQVADMSGSGEIQGSLSFKV